MKNFLHRLMVSVENAPLSLASFLATFIALIFVRLTVESALASFEERTFFFLFFEFTHTFLFFLCSFIILIPVVRYAGASTLKKAVNVLLSGFLIILLPPLIDAIIFRGTTFWSFYKFDSLTGLLQRFFTFFGDAPNIGITYGVRIEVAITIVALAAYAYLKSKNIQKALLTGLLTYVVLFILGTFPSWLTFIVLFFEKSLFVISGTDIASLFLTPERILGRELPDFRSALNFKMSFVYALLLSALMSLLLFREYPKYFFALLKNSRLPQVTYHNGLLFLGMILAVTFANGNVEFQFFHVLGIATLFIAVECAWFASVIVNDLYDTKIDTLTNPKRPLIENTIPPDLYRVFGVIFFLISFLFAGLASFSALLILLSYQAIAWLYSAPPLRLKQYPLIATLLAAAAGTLVLILGFVATSETRSIEGLPLPLLAYLFAAYFLIIPIKDFKDIAGDKHDHVYTIPVLLGETLAKHLISSLIFLIYVGSPLVLHMRSLFLPALLFGALSFFALQKGTNDETSFFAFRKLPGIILGLAEVYGLIIIVNLFW